MVRAMEVYVVHMIVYKRGLSLDGAKKGGKEGKEKTRPWQRPHGLFQERSKDPWD